MKRKTRRNLVKLRNVAPDPVCRRNVCSKTGHGNGARSGEALEFQITDLPALYPHEKRRFTSVPPWKLYENPFFVDGKLIPKYLNAPLNHVANSFTSTSKGTLEQAIAPLGVKINGSPSLFGFDKHSELSAGSFDHHASLWQHHGLCKPSLASRANVPLDVLNAIAQGPCAHAASPNFFPFSPLHLDRQIPSKKKSEWCSVNLSRAHMATCSVQATLANILQRLRAVEDNQTRSNAAIAKLRLESEDGLSRIQEVEFSHETTLREINSLLQRFGEQMKITRRKEQEKLRAAFARFREEIEEERNMCRLLRLQNKKLLKELEEANGAAADAGEELHRERCARELMEEVCNELAREIGEDKAEVEQLKHEHAKSREKVEQELKMIRMASLWKDERVKTKILEVQRELDDRHRMGLSAADLKSRVEEFMSTLSVVGREAYKASTDVHIENKDEKQKKNIIEQAKLLRCALELSMRQIPGNGGSKLDLGDEKTVTPFLEVEDSQDNVCECFSDKVHKCENDESCPSIDHVELQARLNNHMFNHSRNSFKHVRRPQGGFEGDDLFYHDANTITQPRKHLHDSDGDSELECTSRRTTLDSASVKEISDQKQLSLHLQGVPKSPEQNTGLWEDDVTPSSHRFDCYAEDDVSQKCFNVEGGFSMQEQCESCLASYGRTGEEMDTTCLWKSPPGSCQEHLSMNDNQIDYDRQCSMRHHVCKDGNSVCADGANSCAVGLGKFDGFYFEPVMADDALVKDDCIAHYQQDSDGNGHIDAQHNEDKHGNLISEAYGRSAQQNRSHKEPACTSQLHDGVEWTNAQLTGISSTASCQDEGLTPSPSPPHKLVLPTPNAIRAPSGKSQYASRRSATRSISPSKPQVLQCFRPPPSSPEHETAKLFVPDSSKGLAKDEGGEAHSSRGSSYGRSCLLRPSFNWKSSSLRREEEGGARLVSVGHLEETSGSKMGISEEKVNTLRAELLRAKESDLQHTNYGVNMKATPLPVRPSKTSSPSSFRFSPLRRSLTSSSQSGH